MNMKHASFFTLLILGIFFTSCEKDTDLTPNPDEKQGMLEVEITDAPIDDPAVKSVFVTFADLQIDDQSMPQFTPVTIDLLTLQNGTTAVLGSDSINIGSYNEVALILDANECYVEDVNGNRHDLEPEEVKVELNHAFDVQEDSSLQLLVDFDLRKTVHRDGNDSTDRYDFVPSGDLQQGLRIMNKAETGQLTGLCEDVSTESEMIVAYIYKKGEFNADTETEIENESQLRFKNAVTSTMVQSDGNYTFPFLESGEYELHFASYLENSSTDEVEFRGLLEVNAGALDDVLNITIESSTETEIDLSVTGLLPL